MDTEIMINNAPEVWAAIGVLFGTLILILIGVATLALSGTKALEYLKMFSAEIKDSRQRIYEAVDEPSDILPTQMAELTPWKDDPSMWSAVFKAMVEVALQYQPPKEVNLTPFDTNNAVGREKYKVTMPPETTTKVEGE